MLLLLKQKVNKILRVYPIIIKDLFFNEIDSLTEDKHKESGLYMISLIAELKDNWNTLITKVITESEIN